MKTVTVTFSAVGTIQQVVELDDSISPSDLEKGLNDGSIATSILEGAEVIMFVKGERDYRVIGKIVNTSPDAEYTEFEVEEVEGE